MEWSISIRPDYVLMEVNRLGVKTPGTHVLQLLHGLVIYFCLLLPRLMVSNQKSIDFVLAFPQTHLDVPVYMELPA